MTMLLLLLVLPLPSLAQHSTLPEETINAQGATPDCDLRIRPTDKEGNAVHGTTVDSELYWWITCENEAADSRLCLNVVNCTVSDGADESFEVIDANGCSTADYLFEHPERKSNTAISIFNPYVVRFRSSDALIMNCAAQLSMKDPVKPCPLPGDRRRRLIRIIPVNSEVDDLEISSDIRGATVQPVRISGAPTTTAPTLVIITPSPVRRRGPLILGGFLRALRSKRQTQADHLCNV